MKRYIHPEMEITEFEATDIITASGPSPDIPGGEMGDIVEGE